MKFHIKRGEQKLYKQCGLPHGNFEKVLFPEWIRSSLRDTDMMFGPKDRDIHTEFVGKAELLQCSGNGVEIDL